MIRCALKVMYVLSTLYNTLVSHNIVRADIWDVKLENSVTKIFGAYKTTTGHDKTVIISETAKIFLASLVSSSTV